MAVTSADVVRRLTVPGAGSGNSAAQADPNASLGEYVSATQLVSDQLHNLFDVVTGDENAAGDVEYRAIAVVNTAAQTWFGVVAWVGAQDAGGADYAIGLDPAGVVAIGSASAQGEVVADEGTAPAGVSFSAPADKASGLTIGDMAAGTAQLIWVRRTALAGGAVDDDSVTINYSGDMAA